MSKRKTTEEFKKEASLKHNNKYDYSEVNYIDSKTKVIITCLIHGPFLQEASSHVRGFGCPKCSKDNKDNRFKLSLNEFIKLSNEKHDNKYDYSLIKEYNGHHGLIKIICPIHGEFEQKAGQHIKGSGCPKCVFVKLHNIYKSNKDEFIYKSRKVHGERYDYSFVKYKNAHTNVIIVCKKHGEFKQTPGSHLRGSGCLHCYHEQIGERCRLTFDEFVKRSEKLHGKKYDYSKVDYRGIYKKIIIICSKHGEFIQKPTTHLKGCGCPECGKIKFIKSKTKTREKFIEEANKIHNNSYVYDKVVYKGARIKVIITCKKHGDFKQQPNNHLQGNGCPKCSNSLGEQRVERWLKEQNIIYEMQKTFDGCRNKLQLKFDFYLPDYNMCIEYDGEQHHKGYFAIICPEKRKQNLKRIQLCDGIKTEFCKNNNINLLRVPYTKFKKIEKILEEKLII